MRVLLVNPPWEKPGHYYVRAGSRWPHFERNGTRYMPFPFFMGYAAAVLIKNGMVPKVIDACGERLSRLDFFQRITAVMPDLVVMETSTPSFANDRTILQEMKKRLPLCRFAVAGAWQDADSQSYLSLVPEADFFLEGEYEETLYELVQGLERKKDLHDILSLEFRANNAVIKTSFRPLRPNLDEIPFPARQLFKMEVYEDLVGCLPVPSLQLWGSRGCPFGCTFCVWPQIMYRSRNYRIRSPEKLVDEIEFELKRFPCKSFYFDDDTFNIGKERMLAFCDELLRRKINLPWGMMARADTSDEETLTKMRTAGLVAAKFGMESANQALVDVANKSLNLEVALKNIRFAKSLGVNTHLTFTFGLPGETKETIKKTIGTVLDLDPSSVQFSILTPFPGCDLFQTLRKQNLLTSLDFTKYDGYSSAVFKSELLSAKTLEKACAYAEKRWRKHQMRRWITVNPLDLLKKVFLKPEKAFSALINFFPKK